MSVGSPNPSPHNMSFLVFKYGVLSLSLFVSEFFKHGPSPSLPRLSLPVLRTTAPWLSLPVPASVPLRPYPACLFLSFELLHHGCPYVSPLVLPSPGAVTLLPTWVQWCRRGDTGPYAVWPRKNLRSYGHTQGIRSHVSPPRACFFSHCWVSKASGG